MSDEQELCLLWLEQLYSLGFKSTDYDSPFVLCPEKSFDIGNTINAVRYLRINRGKSNN